MATHPVKHEPVTVRSSQRKLKAAHLLEQVAVTVSDGGDYALQDWLRPQASLAEARTAWKPMDTSFTAVIIDEREHS
jgi:hypothetical protein